MGNRARYNHLVRVPMILFCSFFFLLMMYHPFLLAIVFFANSSRLLTLSRQRRPDILLLGSAVFDVGGASAGAGPGEDRYTFLHQAPRRTFAGPHVLDLVA